MLTINVGNFYNKSNNIDNNDNTNNANDMIMMKII